MATSVIEICNNALLDLGEDAIMSLGDNSKAAGLCNHRWPAVRDAVLRAHPWNCAMAQAELAAGTAAPLWKWEYKYVLPTDFLRVIRVVGADGTEVLEWEIQSGIILCDEEPPLFISYVRRETDPKKYDALLAETLSARMAATLAYPLSGSTALAQSCWKTYQEKLTEARGVDAREGVPESVVPATWLGAKIGRPA
ncbi:MAG: hypothetical protein AB7E51_12210 [Pseudodesulfovibrio sp.]|jgi:hypothetical protein|uniref:Phage tail protein n=1 Tax=Pseudodesulfovibrio indicus TaxID=1716143 RepID=A0A126QJX5_9BACT|nr:hypothetical protein [Pseudodesulfovibrio indicus]AMK10320.1 hypothetical protein AWY79_03895 [Pseudodesulfovibrio indicus]TDT81935.1 hypothetical protein EDC59_1209 [Pseudodesulfovibrio indicus]